MSRPQSSKCQLAFTSLPVTVLVERPQFPSFGVWHGSLAVFSYPRPLLVNQSSTSVASLTWHSLSIIFTVVQFEFAH
jgi:hypothetical protein